MRILVVSDIHYSLKQFDWVLGEAEKYDLIVIAGDLLDVAGHADLDSQIVVAAKYLNRIGEKCPLLVCSGNHDGDVKNEADEYVAEWLQDVRRENLHVDGDSVEFAGSLLTVCPWWDGPVTREALGRQIEEEGKRAPERWFWVHHAPPDESPVSLGRNKYLGDAFLVDRIHEHRPAYVFSGHIHNSPFTKGGSWIDRIGSTWVFNPGREFASVPSHIVLDMDRMQARWISSMGVQEADLNDDEALKAVQM